jgi:tetratricopeptide (TPR) repeat protein
VKQRRIESRIATPGKTVTHRWNTNEMFWIGVAIFVIVLHLYGAINPSGLNWGIHLFGFLDAIYGIVALVIAALAVVWTLRGRLLGFVEEAVAQSKRIPRAVLYGLLGGGSLVLFYLLRQRVFLLGDGYLYIEIIGRPTILGKFWGEPLNAAIYFPFSHLLQSLGIVHPAMSYIIINTAAGVVFLFLLIWISRRLCETPVERAMVVGFVMSSGVSQLFFGYVENYTLLSVAIVLYLALLLYHLHGKVSGILPAAAFGLMFTLHLGSIFFAPTLALTYLRGRNIGKVLAWGGIAAATASIVLILMGFPFSVLVETFFQKRSLSGSHVLPMAEMSSDWQRYTIFSWEHLTDILNQQLLVAPFALFLIGLVCSVAFRQIKFRDTTFLVLAVASVCALLFQIVVNCEVGASRDWDLVAPYSIPILLLAAYLVVKYLPKTRRVLHLFLLCIVLSALHAMAFMLTNALPQQGANRFEALIDARLWARNAVVLGSADLMQRFYVACGDAQRAVAIGEKFARQYPNDAYMLKLAGDMHYEHAKQPDKAEVFYRRAVEISTEPTAKYFRDACVRLGNLYSNEGKLDEAIAAYQKATAANPELWDAYFNLGMAYLEKKEFASALKNFQEVLNRDSTVAIAYKNAGIACLALNDTVAAKRYWQHFLIMKPNDPDTLVIQRTLENI